jgi:hypothetical protein
MHQNRVHDLENTKYLKIETNLCVKVKSIQKWYIQ